MITPSDIKLVHFLTTQVVRHYYGKITTNLSSSQLFVGSDIHATMKQGLAEYVSISIMQVSLLIAISRIQIGVALI